MALTIISEETEQSTQQHRSSGVESYSYPSTVGSESDDRHTSYLIFNAVEAVTDSYDVRAGSLRNRRNQYLKSSNARTRSGLKENSLAFVQMYMPAMIENFTHNYEQSNTSFIADIANILQNAAGAESPFSFDNIKSSGIELWDSSVEGIKALAQGLANETVVRTTGVLRGQRQAGLYSGTALRTHNFFFQLRPKDLNELKNVGRIIRIFQKYSSAKLVNEDQSGSNSFNTIEVPPIWYIEERQRDQGAPRFIPKFNFGPAVISDIKVNKTPDQLYTTFKNTGGDPVSVDLEIQFQELIPVYQDYWDITHEELS